MKKKSKILTSMMLLTVSLFLLIGCGASKSKEDNVEAKNTSSSKEEKKENYKEIYNMNETVNIYGVDLTVSKVEKTNSFKDGKEKIDAEAGKEIVVVWLKAKNVSKEELSANQGDFELQNSKGELISTKILMGFNGWFRGKLVPGGETEGFIIFENTKGDSGLILHHKALKESFGQEKLHIKFKLD